MDNKPKLLFLSGYFPPAKFSSGCVRTWNIARHLARLGWDVSVVTPHPSVWKPQFVENAEQVALNLAREGIHPIYTGHRWRFLSPSRLNTKDEGLARLLGGFLRRVARLAKVDTWSGWVPEAEKTLQFLKSSDVDVILASGAPFVSFTLAEKFARRLRRPFVLDYRDLWVGDPHLLSVNPHVLQLEHTALEHSAAVISISPSIAAVLAQRCQMASKLHVITNGFDADEMNIIQPTDFEHFAFVYTGTIHPPLRTLLPFMEAMAGLMMGKASLRNRWRLHYYGLDGDIVLENAAHFGVKEQVTVHGLVPRQEALQAVKGAGLVLVVTSVANQGTVEEKGVVTGKIFEAIGLQKPFLVIAPLGSDVEEVVTTSGLGACFPAQDIRGIQSFIANVMQGNIPQAKNPESYSWERLGQKMDTILRGVIRHG